MEPICLDPSTQVLRVSTLNHYNTIKYQANSRTDSLYSLEPTTQPNTNGSSNLMHFMDPKKKDFYPQFDQYNFIQEWRRKKMMADSEGLIGLGDKIKIKPGGKLLISFDCF